MAKSLRSKAKRAFRAKKRVDGVYAATHAARLQRLHAKIDAIVATPKPVRDETLEDAENAEGDEEVQEEMTGEHGPWVADDYRALGLICKYAIFFKVIYRPKPADLV